MTYFRAYDDTAEVSMKVIALRFEYEEYYIEVPEDIYNNIKKIRKEFDKWLYDKNNDHGYWVKVNGVKKGVSYDESAFIDFINERYIKKGDARVRIIEKDEIPDSCDITTELF